MKRTGRIPGGGWCLSRLTVDDVDTHVLTAEQTAVGLTTIRRIAELSHQLPIRVGRLIWR